MKLLEQIKSFCEQSALHDPSKADAFREVIAQINTLMQPETMDFQWPVPDGWRVETMDGREVKQLTRFEGVYFEMVGVVDRETFTRTWRIKGTHNEDARPSDYDLILRRIQPKTRTVWVVMDYIKDNNMLRSFWYSSPGEALIHHNIKESDLVKVTIELP